MGNFLAKRPVSTRAETGKADRRMDESLNYSCLGERGGLEERMQIHNFINLVSDLTLSTFKITALIVTWSLSKITVSIDDSDLEV